MINKTILTIAVTAMIATSACAPRKHIPIYQGESLGSYIVRSSNHDACVLGASICHRPSDYQVKQVIAQNARCGAGVDCYTVTGR